MINYLKWWSILTLTGFVIYLMTEPTSTTAFILGVGLLIGLFSAILAAVVSKLLDLEEPPKITPVVASKKPVVVATPVKKTVVQQDNNDWEDV